MHVAVLGGQGAACHRAGSQATFRAGPSPRPRGPGRRAVTPMASSTVPQHTAEELGIHASPQRPDATGRYGKYGGKYVPETLITALTELEAAYAEALADPSFVVRRGMIVTCAFLCACVCVWRSQNPSLAGWRRSQQQRCAGHARRGTRLDALGSGPVPGAWTPCRRWLACLHCLRRSWSICSRPTWAGHPRCTTRSACPSTTVGEGAGLVAGQGNAAPTLTRPVPPHPPPRCARGAHGPPHITPSPLHPTPHPPNPTPPQKNPPTPTPPTNPPTNTAPTTPAPRFTSSART